MSRWPSIFKCFEIEQRWHIWRHLYIEFGYTHAVWECIQNSQCKEGARYVILVPFWNVIWIHSLAIFRWAVFMQMWTSKYFFQQAITWGKSYREALHPLFQAGATLLLYFYQWTFQFSYISNVASDSNKILFHSHLKVLLMYTIQLQNRLLQGVSKTETPSNNHTLTWQTELWFLIEWLACS